MTECEFCKKAVGSVEVELLNLSEGEVLTAMCCPTCAVLSTMTRISTDSDGIQYSNFGCIGGAPEDTH